jgi:ABC-2 type transport system ATP-binding protein
MDAHNIALSLKKVSKDFVLPHEKQNSLKERVLSFKKPTYEKLHVLKGIDVEIKKGEFFGIVGRNGSGKSTLLKIIGGIYQPTAGEVKVNGTLTPFIELGIGFNPDLTGRENVFLNGAILGLARKEIKQKYEEIVNFAELEKFMDQKLKNYSSGMQVRLAFSIAIQAHNDILLIDEVLAVGDANFQRKCFKIFKEIKDSGKSVVFVTHDMGAIQEYCDRAMMINDGKVVAIGAPRDVALSYELANTVKGFDNLDDSLSRPKNPAVKLMKIDLRSRSDQKNEFSLDEDIYVDVTFEVKKEIEFQLNLYIVKADGTQVAGINSTKDMKNFSPPSGIHTLTCKLKAGQLSMQDYRVNVAAYTTDRVPELIDIQGDWKESRT